MPKINVLVAGSTGYIGVQLIKLLVKHKYVDIRYLCGNNSVGKKISNFDKTLSSKKLPKIVKFNKKYLDSDYVLYRTGFKDVTDLIKINNDISLLTFDSRLMVWAILNDVDEIKPLSGQLVSKTHLMIENDLIDSFKFFKLDIDLTVSRTSIS